MFKKVTQIKVEIDQFPQVRKRVFQKLGKGLSKLSDRDLHIGFLVVPYLDDLAALMTPEDAGIRLAARIRILMDIDRYSKEMLNQLMDTPGLHTDLSWAVEPELSSDGKEQTE